MALVLAAGAGLGGAVFVSIMDLLVRRSLGGDMAAAAGLGSTDFDACKTGSMSARISAMSLELVASLLVLASSCSFSLFSWSMVFRYSRQSSSFSSVRPLKELRVNKYVLNI